MSKSKGSHHVVPNPDGGWKVKKGGSSKSSGNFDTKKEAVDVEVEVEPVSEVPTTEVVEDRVGTQSNQKPLATGTLLLVG